MTEDISPQNQREIRLAKAHNLRKSGVEPYVTQFKKSHSLEQLQNIYSDLANEQSTSDVVSVVGRVMAMRNSGMFIVLQDSENNIQIFSHKKNLSEDQLEFI